MATKLSKLTAAFTAGDFVGAMRIAAKFPQLGDQKAAIMTAWNALQSPDFYRQLGRDPDALFRAGVAALVERYSLPAPASVPNVAG